MYWPKSVPIKEEKGVRDKKRHRDKGRARDGPKRYANYGPILPVSIPMLLERVAQAWLAQTPAFIRRVCRGFRRRLEACAAAQGGYIEKK